MFAIILERLPNKPGQVPPSCEEYGKYDPELDDITTVLNDACKLLRIAGCVRFGLEGFNHPPWPADVWLHLSVLLEQVPDLVTWLLGPGDGAYPLDFYEQGMELYFTLRRVGDSVTITWDSGPGHPGGLPTETLNVAHFRHMITQVVNVVVAEVSRLCSRLASHPWFVDWRNQCQFDR